MKTNKIILLLTCALLAFGQLQAQDLVKKANTFLDALSPELKAQALFPFDGEERSTWHFVPMDNRKGPTFHDFNDAQKKAAIDLLQSSISKEGYRKSTEIRQLEGILKTMENNPLFPDGTPKRDPLNYHFCIFGTPSATEAWGWRFEGHHQSLNFTFANGILAASTPSFFGTNPGIVQSGEYQGKEVLKQESDLGFKLVNSLDAQQLKTARYSETAPPEIITGTASKVEGLDPKGIAYPDLTPAQQKTFMSLLNVYIDNYEFGFAKTLRTKIMKAGQENLSFAWAGSLSWGSGYYYRIQGPMLLIEFDNTQNNANHVHTVVRDLTNDYAEDILREHYKKSH